MVYGVWMIVRPYDLNGGGGGCACMSDRVSCSVINRENVWAERWMCVCTRGRGEEKWEKGKEKGEGGFL